VWKLLNSNLVCLFWMRLPRSRSCKGNEQCWLCNVCTLLHLSFPSFRLYLRCLRQRPWHRGLCIGYIAAVYQSEQGNCLVLPTILMSVCNRLILRENLAHISLIVFVQKTSLLEKRFTRFESLGPFFVSKSLLPHPATTPSSADRSNESYKSL